MQHQPGVDEICPESPKAQDVVVLSWLRHLCNITWAKGAAKEERQRRMTRLQGTERQIQEERCGFHPGCGTCSIPLGRVMEGLWEFAQQVYMCFLDLEKAYDHVTQGVLCGGFYMSIGMMTPYYM